LPNIGILGLFAEHDKNKRFALQYAV